MARPKKREPRVLGPYKDGHRWRVVVVRPGGGGDAGRARTRRRSYDTEEEALEVIAKLREKIGAISVGDAIDEWEQYLKTTGVKDVSVYTVVVRVRGFFSSERRVPISAITEARVKELYEKLRERPRGGWVNPLAHEPQPQKKIAVQTHRGMLSAVKRFLDWCIEERGYIRRNPAEAVKPVGVPHRGKEQLRFDETRKLQETCARELAGGDGAALAVLLASVLGLRASEVANMQVRDVDDGGRIVWVACSKTPAGRRTQETAWLAPWLGAFVQGRIGRLFPERSRHWVLYHTKRLCTLAGVPESTAHGLRGTHATAAAEGGATAAAMMAGLGWAGPDVGPRHYIRAGAVESARTRRAAARLMPPASTEGEE